MTFSRRAAFMTAGALVAIFAETALAQDAGHEAELLSHVRQLIFEGQRSGEGYFSADGSKLVFQSEREADNPFYQIYLMDLDTGDTERMSPGVGMTSCAWIHPDGKRLLFASTHEDPDAKAKQEQEFKERAESSGRRYSWDFDEHYDIYARAIEEPGEPENLTSSPGYDAEGAYSPDGTEIVFASNRQAYERELSEAEQAIFERDPSYFMDLYIMNADGSNLRRLSNTPGYDGGPFFSADGKKIVWRRFAEDGHTAEVYTMNRDGSGEQAITRLGALSWAPYFHPSGDYIIFATSVQGFDNFELYLVDAAGQQAPVRVTSTQGFDGLPVFTPDGQRLAWSTSRGADKKPQIFMADWDDAAARRLLGLGEVARLNPGEVPSVPETIAEITAEDLRLHVEILASEEMEGRLTGSKGELKATEYVANAMERLGLEPAGDDGSYFQPFDFTAGVTLGEGNQLSVEPLEGSLEVDRAWRPLGMSIEGAIEPAGVAFAGYGIVAPGSDGQLAYDSYGDLDVTGKWVLMFRHLPEQITAERRQYLHRYGDLGYKAAVAKERGAAGIMIVSGPTSSVTEPLVPLTFDASAASALGAISISDDLAGRMLRLIDKDLQAVQQELDHGEQVPGFDLPDVQVEAEIVLEQTIKRGRNVLARLSANDGTTGSAVIIGAHVDHLGRGVEGKSLATGDERGEVHFGADDNASGVAGMLEIAEYLAGQKAAGKLTLPRDIVFAAWSGEELGLLGSSHFVNRFAGETRTTLQPEIAAYLNLDMIGHYDDRLFLQGVESSDVWRREIERRNAPVGLAISTDGSAFLPTDTTAFYLKGVPVLNAFTGVHDAYSTPRDKADTLNYEGAADVARLMALITRAIASAEDIPTFVKQAPGEQASSGRRTSSVYLGTVPDYTRSDVEGALINGVAEGGPAEAAGMKSGDQVVEIAGRPIANIYDYSHALDGLKIGAPVDFVVLRDGERITLTITPGSRDEH